MKAKWSVICNLSLRVKYESKMISNLQSLLVLFMQVFYIYRRTRTVQPQKTILSSDPSAMPTLKIQKAGGNSQQLCRAVPLGHT